MPADGRGPLTLSSVECVLALSIDYEYLGLPPVTCPCSGDAVIRAVSATSDNVAVDRVSASEFSGVNVLLSFPFASEFSLTVNWAATCSDNATDPCESTCTTVYCMGTGLDNGADVCDDVGRPTVTLVSSNCVATSS